MGAPEKMETPQEGSSLPPAVHPEGYIETPEEYEKRMKVTEEPESWREQK